MHTYIYRVITRHLGHNLHHHDMLYWCIPTSQTCETSINQKFNPWVQLTLTVQRLSATYTPTSSMLSDVVGTWAQNLQSVNSTAAVFFTTLLVLFVAMECFNQDSSNKWDATATASFGPNKRTCQKKQKHWSIMKPKWQNGRNWISWSFLLIHSCHWIEKWKGCTTIKRQAVRFKWDMVLQWRAIHNSSTQFSVVKF